MSNIKNWALRTYVTIKHRDEEGQGLAEYGLILALIAVACIVALTALGGGIAGALGGVTAKL
jgi:pilus assembly protein Flp/PilA